MRFTFIILPSPHIMHSIRSNQKVLITIFSIQLFYCIKYSYLNIIVKNILNSAFDYFLPDTTCSDLDNDDTNLDKNTPSGLEADGKT